MLEKIISGAQTGVDRGALIAAKRIGFPYGGYVPKGRLAEDGPISDRFKNLIEMPTADYPLRTRKNVQESDATYIIVRSGLTPGSILTKTVCHELSKAFMILRLDVLAERGATEFLEQHRQWVDDYEIKILNVAGSRESKAVGIERDTCLLISFLLSAQMCILL